MIARFLRFDTRRFTHAPLVLASILILLVCIGMSIHFWMSTMRATRSYYNSCQAQTEKTASIVNSFIAKHNEHVIALAHDLSQGAISKQQLIAKLQEKPTELSGLGFIDFTTQQILYYVEQDGRQTLIEQQVPAEKITRFKEITRPSSALHTDPITNHLMHYFVAPIVTKNRITGIIFSAQSMAHIKHMLTSLFVGQKSYWLITDAQGTLLVHPFASWIQNKKNITLLGTQVAQTIQQAASLQETQVLTYHNEITAHASWLFVTPIGSTGMILGGVFDSNEIPISNNYYRQWLFTLIIGYTLALLLLVLGATLAMTPLSISHLWISSMCASAILLIALIASWFTAHSFPYFPQSGTPIMSKAHLYTLLDAYSNKTQMAGLIKPLTSDLIDNQEFSRMLNYRYKTGRYVPTGFLINDIQMKSQDSIEFVAFIWQRYFDGIHDGISRGFILPQIASKPTITEISRTKIEKAETIIWQVRCELNQNFSYQTYPFDVKNIDFQIRHKDFDKQITLVPDIDAYAVLNPAALPGIGKDTSLINWQLLRSYFSFQLEQFNTNFGLYAYGPFGIYQEVSLDHVPELHFNVISQRYLVDTLVSDLLPPCVIAVILFVLLLTYFAEGTFELLLETSAAAFFSTVFAQVQFRSKIPSNEFVYFELFYFTLYALILLILCTTLIHMFKIRIPIIDYKNNIITKLLYWPMLFGVLIIGTIAYLY